MTQAYRENYSLIDWSGMEPRQRPVSTGFFNARSEFPAPMVMPDTPEYVSPVTNKLVAGRVARKEDLKRAGCREVDPSEFKPSYRNKKYQKRYSRQNTED